MTRFDRTPAKARRARELRRDETPFEKALWAQLRAGGVDGVAFRRQHPFGPYVLDFYAPEIRLAVEGDGPTHGGARDALRTEFLAARGVDVLRFWNEDVRGGIDGVVAALADHVRRRRIELGLAGPALVADPPLSPPFQGGGPTALVEEGSLHLHDQIPPLEKGGQGGDQTRGRKPEPPLTPEEFARVANVSRETLLRLRTFDARLLEASARMNLVARSTLEDRWRRHFLDCAQLYRLLPAGAKTLVDLGSGAGFPGLVLAAIGARQALHVTLVESVQKKAAFLAEAARAMGLTNVAVLAERLEKAALSPPDVITARALAPLGNLLSWVHEISGPSTLCLFHKGQDVEAELTEATKSWKIDVERHPSLTSPDGVILAIRAIGPRRERKA